MRSTFWNLSANLSAEHPGPERGAARRHPIAMSAPAARRYVCRLQFRLVGMCAQDDLIAELLFDVGLQLVKIDWALCGLHGQLDAGSQMYCIDLAIESPGDFSEEFHARNDQAGAVSAVCHCDQVDIVMAREFSVLFVHCLITFCTSNAGVVLDSFAVNDGDVCHVFLHEYPDFAGARGTCGVPPLKG